MIILSTGCARWRTLSFMLSARILPLLMSLSTAGAFADAPLVPDEYTLLLAHFDKGANADHSIGVGLAEGGGSPITGRFGGGVLLRPRAKLHFNGHENFPKDEGTIEFWIQPQWNGDDGQTHQVLDAAAGIHNQLSINKLATGRFGAGMFGTPSGSTNFVYRRADAKITAWKAGEWHHVAVCWGKGELALWLDGQKVSSKTGLLPPQGVPNEIHLFGTGHVLDELCISRIVRYTDNGRVTGAPVAPHARLNHDWKFNEPAGVYRCEPPKDVTAEAGVVILPKNYLDETDPQHLPPAHESRIELFASPGEVEPATFLVVATEPLSHVTVSVSELKSQRGALSSQQIVVRRVVRTLERRIYTAKPDETQITNRFLPRWTPLDIAAGELREVWLEFGLPESIAPGTYRGTVTISHTNGKRTIPLVLDVLPIHLLDHPRKSLASYYTMERKMQDRERALRELRDMRAHGIRNLCAAIGIHYATQGDQIVADFTELKEGLDLLREAGFRGGTIVVGTGFASLARALGHDDLGHGNTGESLDGDKVFWQVAKEAMKEFVKFQKENSDFRLFVTHLDEVFNENRLPLYIRLSKAARQVPGVKLYVTFHTLRDADETRRREIDPWVDLRCNHGYSFELWLAHDHTMNAYDEELRGSGDEAWFYHNARGPWWNAEWSRIINGLYLWASPFTAHCPWTYQGYYDNPFDDTDGGATKGHDWGLSFPGIDDPANLVPTRLYEAMREGGDDLRYLATLEKTISQARGKKTAEAANAQAVLDRWRNLIRNARPTPQPTSSSSTPPPTPAVDADTGLIMGSVAGKGTIGTASESPVINALAARHTGQQWQQMRREIADWIIRLQ